MVCSDGIPWDSANDRAVFTARLVDVPGSSVWAANRRRAVANGTTNRQLLPLARRALAGDMVGGFRVETHTGYLMVKEARAFVASVKLGKFNKIVVGCPQGFSITALKVAIMLCMMSAYQTEQNLCRRR